jgi:hypothetical protein
MDECLNKEYETAKLKKINPHFIVAEWGVMPKLSLWNKADYRILTDAPKDERNKKLYERPHHPLIQKDDYINSGDEREKAYRDIIQSTTNNDYLIYNTYDDHLEKEVKYLETKIEEGKELNLPL